jgi:hypothetical protein
MTKNKMIGATIILFLFAVPFNWGYLGIEGTGGIVQALCMGFIIIAAVVAIVIFNKDTGEAH